MNTIGKQIMGEARSRPSGKVKNMRKNYCNLGMTEREK